jgi:hypothetical protein
VARQQLIVSRKILWQLRRCTLRVLNRSAQADTRPAARVDNLATPPVRKVSGARQHPATIADNELELELIQSHMTQKPMLRSAGLSFFSARGRT